MPLDKSLNLLSKGISNLLNIYCALTNKTISEAEEEFKDWFNSYIDTDLKKKREVKCSL